jgi:hypothetical protein
LKIRISPNRAVNRYDIFAKKMEFKSKWSYSHQSKDTQFNRKGKKLLSYYVVTTPLEMEFNINAGSVFDMELMESSFDLMRNPLFSLQKSFLMMPTPFCPNRCRGYQTKIKPTPKTIENPLLHYLYSLKKRIIIATDTAKVR